MSGDHMRSLDTILADLLRLLQRPGADTGWTRYSTVDEAVALVESLRRRAAQGDGAVLREVWFHCLPTGTFQEIALSSGWHDEFTRLADEVDALTSSTGPGSTAP